MPFFDMSKNRRQGERKAVNLRGLIVAAGLELRCVIVDLSDGGMKVRLDRGVALPDRFIIVDIAAGQAHEAQAAWAKGQEAGLKTQGRPVPLGGLAPARFVAARDAWLRVKSR